MIRPWIFEFVNSFAYRNAPLYDWYLDLWQQAETTGFEGIFFSEHHFRGNATSPSPHLLLAATAVRTTKLRLGVMGNVLPLHTAWRVAEEIGMLSHLTHARLEVGYSSGIGPAETTIAGIPLDEVRPRFDEAVEIIEQAIKTGHVSHRGKFWNYELDVLPRPLLALPPRWMTVLGTGSAASAAARGFKICTGFLPVPEVKAVFDAYRNQIGRDCPENLGLRRQVFLADSNDEACAIAAEAEAAMRARMGGNRPRSPDSGSPDSGSPDSGSHDSGSHDSGAHDSGAHNLVPDAPTHNPLDFMFGPGEQINGTPARVAEQIIEQCRTTGAGHLLAFVFGSIPRDKIERSYRLWAEIIPVLRSARIS